MQDGIIKGTGNSRLLKSAITEATTWEQFRAALIAGTLPIDLAGINADGWQQIGMAFAKAKILSDTTAAKYFDSLVGTETPDQVLARLPAIAFPWSLIQSYTVADTYTFTVPDLYDGADYEIGVYEIGAGGSGGAMYSSNASYMVATGGASGYGRNVILTVTPGQEITVIVGAGGASVVDSVSNTSGVNGNAGGSTSFNAVSVNGGDGGKAAFSTCMQGNNGGTGSDASPSQKSVSSYGCTAAFGYDPGDGNRYFPGGTSQSPKEGQNQFNPTMVTLAAGGCSSNSQVGATLQDGTNGGNGASNSSGAATATSATGNGNGGGGARSYGGIATSGAGSDGAVYIYVRKRDA